MRRITVRVGVSVGLHARPASMFVKTTKQYVSSINIMKGNEEADGKSLLRIMSLGAVQGDTLIITAEGEDEEEAICALEELFANNFSE